jgi:hypothetical protein
VFEMHDHELRDLLLTLCTAAGAVLALPWALTSARVLDVVARLGAGALAGLIVAFAAALFVRLRPRG